jgi:hypothetical protein
MENLADTVEMMGGVSASYATANQGLVEGGFEHLIDRLVY